ncbi:Uncharacterized protein TPAR_09101 [Tolypocladium paradoxum]|uniref:Uncharacterized protein n=1 Tax=Tolypocladium paradoxum TaxID=94208 RepID=A0A2S4LAT8_9HYPO|nr:Uncharacterized protein TPAR_09101 [Tolypocladium paradoxum]
MLRATRQDDDLTEASYIGVCLRLKASVRSSSGKILEDVAEIVGGRGRELDKWPSISRQLCGQAYSGGGLALQREMAGSSPSGELRTSRGGFTAEIETLGRLHSTQWFNDQLVLLCLHLAQKRPYVRVGFSVPLHRDTGPSTVQHRPFEMVARKIKEWNDAEVEEACLACFFPVLIHGNHFTLLEINQRDDSIYHYGSLGDGQAQLESDPKTMAPSSDAGASARHATPQPGSRWRPEEDATLLRLLGQRLSWSKMAAALPGRSETSCAARFRRSLAHKQQQGAESHAIPGAHVK